MKNIHTFLIAIFGLVALSACANQSTPSLMNVNKPELATSTHVEQIPFDKTDDISMAILANQYTRFGDGPLEITMAYDPKSKGFTARSARHKLKELEGMLAKKGVHNVKTSTLPVEGEAPSLMVMYPSVTAQGPSDCDHMPGIENHKTQREFTGYRFGCSTETFLAKQIYRPADLRGRGGDNMGVNDARRITSVMETYHTLNQRQASGELDETLERENLQSE